jgi:hypothetical protein
MGSKAKKNLADLKRDLQVIRKEELTILTGGKNKSRTRWNGCGGIVPQ